MNDQAKIDALSSMIDEMRIITFEYKGSTRTVEPHLIGVNKAGHLVLSAFQISGGSEASWRWFLLDQISNLSELSEHFDRPRPGYNENDSTMDRIIHRI